MTDEVFEPTRASLEADTPGDPLHQAVAEKLGHPFHMRRKTDMQLAQAALSGHLGRRPPIDKQPSGSLTEGLRAQRPNALRRAWSAIRARLRGEEVVRTSRRWSLWRSRQVDQADTPWCVDATRVHWQRAVPTIALQHLPLGELYAKCKAIDGWPAEDGTSASAMLQVCQQMGIVASHWWWTGSQDDEAARRWLLDIGPLWFGAGWAESMFRTDDFGLVTVQGDLIYGHETLVIGRTANFRRLGPAVEIVQSWGNDNWGLLGRGWILERDFFGRLMPEGGDLVGIVEARVV